MAKKYGNLIISLKRTIMPLFFDGLDYTQREDRAYANQLWIHGINMDSELHGWDKNLSYELFNVCGLLKTS